MSSTEMDQDIIDIIPTTESPKTEKKVQVECDNSESIVIPEMDQNIEINPANISSESEQKVQVKCVVSSEKDQDVTEETAPDSILSESEQVNCQDSDDDECVIISDFDDDDNNSVPRPRLVMPMPIPIFVEPEENNQGDFQLYNAEYENDNMEVDGCVSNSVPDTCSVKGSIVISDDPDSPEPSKKLKLKSILKRKLNPKYSEYECRKSMKPGPKCKTRYTMPSILKRRIKIPSNTDVEYSRKTMKPGPKSKTRNISTVHELISEARTAGPSLTRLLTLDSEDENTSTDEEESEESEEEYYESSESDIEEPLSPDFKISEEYYEMLKIKYSLRQKARNMEISGEIISLNTTDEESDSDEVINPNIKDLENNVIDVDELEDITETEENVKNNDDLENNVIDVDEIEDIILKTEENDKNNDDDLENNVIDDNKVEDKILKTEENDKNNDDDLENNVIDDNKVEDKILKTEENDKNNDDDLENNVIDDNKVEDKILKTEENDKIDVSDNAMNPNMKDLKNNGDDLKNNEIDDNEVQNKLLNTEENNKIVVLNNVINPNIEDLKNNDNIVDEDKALNNYEMNGKKI